MEENTCQALAFQFKKHLMMEDNEESKFELEKYLVNGCEDPSDAFFYIFKLMGS